MAIRHVRLQFCSIVLWLSSAGFLFVGCAGLNTMEMLQKADNMPTRFELESAPFYPQKAYQCGPAALAIALNWTDLRISPEDLTDEVFTPARKGSLQSSMITAARRHGRIAYVFNGLDGLFPEVVAGHPVIVLQNLGFSWYPVWHYAVVVGYDVPKKIVVLRSGSLARKQMPFRSFENTWARSNYWGLLVLPPDEMPVTVEKDLFLAAVLGLEKARRFRSAIDGYGTALKRWPGSVSALTGIGNCYYALGELKKAESAFKETIRLNPKAGSAYNNLAVILFERGRKQEAVKAAEKAVSLGGPLGSEYQKTLEEIQGSGIP